MTVLATNAYQKTESGWRIILHHASPGFGPSAGETDDYPAPNDAGVTLH